METTAKSLLVLDQNKVLDTQDMKGSLLQMLLLPMSSVSVDILGEGEVLSRRLLPRLSQHLSKA